MAGFGSGNFPTEVGLLMVVFGWVSFFSVAEGSWDLGSHCTVVNS